MSCDDLSMHKLWRSRLSPGLSLRGLLSNIAPILEEVETFANGLKRLAGNDGQWGEIFPIYDKTMSLTYDIIACRPSLARTDPGTWGLHELILQPHCHTGHFRATKIGSLRALATEYIDDWIRATDPEGHEDRRMQATANRHNLKNRIERVTPGYRKTLATNSKVLRDAILPHIQDRFGLPPDTKKFTVIDYALEDVVGQAPSENMPKLDGALLETLISQTKFIFFAGGDVVGMTLAWVFYEITRHPAVLNDLRAEHDKIFGTDVTTVGDDLRKQPYKLNELGYTNAVVKETLRLHSPSQSLRQASSDFNIVIDGVIYPTQYCLLQTSAGTIHRREDIFPRPTEFLPERFLVAEENPLHPPKNAYRPFEMGNMRCIGDELALVEMRLALLYTVREVDFQFDWDGWDRLQGRTGPSQMVFGDRGYVSGSDVGSVKDGLPTRIRFNKEGTPIG
ncbi:cytochrome P450 [Astrocystis sublimbata]|nr:cytochrome P450 [Astrocystis sublimbata]